MSERRRRANLVLDALLTAGCAVCSVQSLCQSILEAEGPLFTALWLLLGLGWLACSAIWIAHSDRFLGKKPGDPLHN